MRFWQREDELVEILKTDEPLILIEISRTVSLQE